MAQPSPRVRGAILVKLLLATVGVAAAGVGGVQVLGQARPGPNKPGDTKVSARDGQSRNLELATAAKTTFDITVTATGDLQAKNQIEIKCEVESETTIAEIVREGLAVKKGDLLFRLNADKIQTQLDEALLSLEGAKAQVVAAENSYKIQMSENESKTRQALLKLELARLDLDQWDKGERVQKLKDIELALDRTEKDLSRLVEKFERSSELNKNGFLSKNDLQLDEIALREARAARAKAELEQNTYTKFQEPKDRKKRESDVEEAVAELERTKQQNEIQLASKEAERANARTTLQLRKDRVEKLEKQKAATEVRAPQDGLVIYATSAGRNWDDSPMAVGRQVRPQETLMVLPDTSQMIAQVRVPEAIAGRLRPGQPATIKVDKLPGLVLTGAVNEIGIVAETQDRWRDPNRREYTVKVLLDDANASGEVALKPSDRCEATIVLGRVQDAIAVPLQAVFREEQLDFVWSPAGSRFERVPVRVGRRSDTMAELAAGLEAGRQVLLREPTPGERLADQWTDDQLKVVGFRMGENGRPERIPGAGGPPGGGPGGAAGRAGRGGPPAASAGGAGGAPEAAASAKGRRPDAEKSGSSEAAKSGATQATADKPETKGDAKPAASTADAKPAAGEKTAAPASAPASTPVAAPASPPVDKKNP